MNTQQNSSKAVKRSFWVAFAFYFLIGFEFFYMISPFAAYFYSVYSPGLHFFNESATFSWLNQIFLPHIVSDTSSAFLNVLPNIGMILAFGGFLLFCLGAAQVYWSKLFKKQAVTGGVYRIVRHPQYAALIVSGFGLLILWPRYIALLAYITMLFFYTFLAKVEEKECEAKFGESYLNYQQQTAMFFPLPTRKLSLSFLVPQKRMARYFVTGSFYLIAVVLGIGMADAARNWSLANLYAVYDINSAAISVVPLGKKQIKEIMDLAMSNNRVDELINKQGAANGKIIGYVMPLDWSASEIPMRPVPNAPDHFDYTSGRKIEKCRVVLTKALQRNQNDSEKMEIITHTTKRIPLAEVVVDLENMNILTVQGPVQNNQLASIPLPVF